MKKLTLTTVFAFLSILFCNAQSKTLSIVNFEVENVPKSPEAIISLTFSEVSKLDTFLLKDKYTVQEAAKLANIEISSCLGESCLLRLGQKMNVDLVMSGRAIRIEDKLIVSLRLFDIKNESILRTSYSEFAYNHERMDKMLKIAVHDLFRIHIDKNLKNSYDYDKVKQNEMDGPKVKRMNLSGPRFGLSALTNKNAQIIQRNRANGGFEKSPVMTVIGYQNEYQYMHTGLVQAIFQTNVSVAGLDQQMAIPSLSFVNGFRLSNSGWEIGFGPVFRLTQLEDIVFSNRLASDFSDVELDVNPTRQIDSRGPVSIQSGWIWAFGKSFKMGQMNVPINVYTIPDRNGWLVGLSMGWAIGSFTD